MRPRANEITLVMMAIGKISYICLVNDAAIVICSQPPSRLLIARIPTGDFSGNQPVTLFYNPLTFLADTLNAECDRSSALLNADFVVCEDLGRRSE